MQRSSPLAASTLALLVAALSPPAPAQPPAAPSFGASVEVEVVEVEVFVTDGRGKPVTGLTPADFRLRVDGEAREIVGFFEAAPAGNRDSSAELSPATMSTASAPAPSATTAVAAPAPTPAPARELSLVVLLDDLHLQPGGRKRTLDRLAPMLEGRVAAGDRVMVATLDRSLTVRRGFDEAGPLAEVLRASGKRAPGGIHTEIARRQALAQIRDLHAQRGCEALQEMRAVASSWAQDVERETRLTFSTLQELLAGLAGRSGRKALLLVTEGMSLNPGLEATLLLEQLCPGSTGGASTGLVGALERVSRAANAAQVTLYTLDAGGQRTLASAGDAGPGLSLADQSAVRSDSQDPVYALAADTGGKALLESNKPELLVADLAQDMAAFYSLAFAPRPGDAGRPHRIAVEVTRPGTRVRHRSGWDPMTREARVGGRLLAALRFGGEDDNPLGAVLETAAPQREADGAFTVPLRLRVPAGALALVPQDGRRRGTLRVLLAVQDGEGRTTPVRALPLPVDLPAVTGAAADEVPLTVRLKLREGRNTIAVAVVDELGQQTSVLRRDVLVGRAR